VYIAHLDLVGEEVSIVNTEPIAVNLTGWTITDEGMRNIYTFPIFTLAPEANVTVHSGPGNDTATDLYWAGQPRSGTTPATSPRSLTRMAGL